jgi:hypothetical protein
LIGVRLRRAAVAGIGHAVAIAIFLIGVGLGQALVADIAEAVAIGVFLIGVRSKKRSTGLDEIAGAMPGT